MLHQSASETDDLSGTLAIRFWEAINQTLAEWMLTGQNECLWQSVEEMRRAVRDFMRHRGDDPSSLKAVDLQAERFRALADFLEAHLQPASASACISRLRGARYARWVQALLFLMNRPLGAKAGCLIAAGIFAKRESADEALRTLTGQGLLAKEGHGGAYHLTFLGRRVADSFSQHVRIGGVAQATGSDSQNPSKSRRPLEPATTRTTEREGLWGEDSALVFVDISGLLGRSASLRGAKKKWLKLQQYRGSKSPRCKKRLPRKSEPSLGIRIAED